MSDILFAAAGAVALIDWLNSKGQQLSITDNILTDMSISSSYTSETSCSSTVSGAQSITIDPDGPGVTYPPADKLRGPNSSCLLCQNALAEIQSMRSALESSAIVTSNGRYQSQTASEPVLIGMTGGPLDLTTSNQQLGACELMCFDVVVLGVQQSQTFKAKTSCRVTTDVTNSISQTIQGKIKASLKNQEDILGSIEDAFTSNTAAISNDIASRMSQTLVNSVRQTLVNNALSVQNFNAGLGGTDGDGNGAHSVFVNTVSQSFTSNSVASLNVTNQTLNSLRQSASFSVAQSLLNKNDTIGDITNSFVKTIDTMGVFMNNLTGLMLIMIGCLLALFVMLTASAYFFTSKGRAFIDNLANVKSKEVEQHLLSQNKADKINYNLPTQATNLPPIQTVQPNAYTSRSQEFLF